jgi:hypothetical protein
MNVATWLHGLELGQYEQAFRENNIGAEVLVDPTSEDLIGIGVRSIGHRRLVAPHSRPLASFIWIPRIPTFALETLAFGRPHHLCSSRISTLDEFDLISQAGMEGTRMDKISRERQAEVAGDQAEPLLVQSPC